MPDRWSDKRERQYEHIKESQVDRGKSESKAKEIAARTVNKKRRESGETENEHTMGTGNPHTSLDARTLDELRNRAEQLAIENAGKLSKSELVNAIRDKQN